MVLPRFERRRYPRLKHKIPLKIKDEEFDAITVSKNISCSGVFCQVEKFFPLLSRVKIILLLPDEERMTAEPISINGAVVRSEPANSPFKTNCYNIAIYFRKIKKRDKLRLANYISSILIKRMAGRR